MTSLAVGHDQVVHDHDRHDSHRRHFDWVIAISVGLILTFAALTIGLVAYNTTETHQTVDQIHTLQVDRTHDLAQINRTLAVLLAFQTEAQRNHGGTYALLVAICHATPGCVVPTP